MRILQLAPLWERVPPPAYGGTEYVVSVLTEELARLGHEVILCASGDSQTSVRLQAVYGRSLRTASDVADPYPYQCIHVALALKAAGSCDVVHNHAGELAMALHKLSGTPMLTTLHNPITPDARAVWDNYEGDYNTPSYAAWRGVSHPNFAGVIHHGIDVASFPFQAAKQDYLLFLSRISPEKGPLDAIAVAKRLGRRLVIAGKVDAKDRAFFQSEVAPLIDGRLIEYVGEADSVLKRDLYRNAACLLFPISWNELFGLVLVEAMACGTPVIAYRAGAASEIVAHGVSGYLVDDVEGIAAAVSLLDKLDPVRIRRYAERRFSARAMAEAYVRTYRLVIERQQSRARRPWRRLPPPPTLVG